MFPAAINLLGFALHLVTAVQRHGETEHCVWLRQGRDRNVEDLECLNQFRRLVEVLAFDEGIIDMGFQQKNSRPVSLIRRLTSAGSIMSSFVRTTVLYAAGICS